MPTYEYRCLKCNHEFDAVQKMTDARLTQCPECRGKLKRLIGSGAGIIFKGSGFYCTDYKNTGSHAGEDKKDSRGSESSASESGKADTAKSEASPSGPKNTDSGTTETSSAESKKSGTGKPDTGAAKSVTEKAKPAA